MARASFAITLLLLGIIGAPAPAVAQLTGLTLDEVKVQGHRRSEPDAILGVIASRKGTTLDRGRVQGDIKAIFQLGFYKDITVELTETDGKRTLVYVVTEKPSIRKVMYEGNDALDDEELKEVVDVKTFGILNLAKVNRNAEKLKDLYTEKGYFLAEVSWDVIELPDNAVDVVFKIIEKEEVKVARLTIVGNRALSESYIKERLETREGGPLAFLGGGGAFKSEAFDRDQMRISQFYFDKGYIKARVGDPKVELSPDRTELFLTVPVQEGERFRTGEVDVTGDFLKPEAEARKMLLKLVPLKQGEWFSSSKLRQAITRIGDVYKDEGYAYVNIVPNTQVDDETQLVTLTIDIDKGQKVRIGRIKILGNTRTRDKVIRREMRLYEGEYYSASGMKRSKRLITRLGYFETVEINSTRGEIDGTMDLTVQIKEKPTGTFQIGAGFSSLESFVAQAQISQNNLFGRGQSLSLQTTLSKIRTIANIRFADNYFMDTRVRFATNIYRFETQYQDFSRESLGGDVTLGYPLNDDWGVSATYTLEQVNVEEGGYNNTNVVTLANLFNSGRTSSVRASIYRDTRNNRLFPSGGMFSTFSVENATPWLMSENEFTRYRIRNRYYYSLGMNIVLKVNGEWGLITSPDSAGVPIFERFFVGGPLSVRGFRRHTLGPAVRVLDSSMPSGGTADFNIGGTEQLITNIELEYPIFQQVGIRGVFFIDGGNAFDRQDPTMDKLEQMRFSWGFGVRWFSPIGPLRFEWGFPFEPESDEQDSVFDFSIGNFF